MNEKSEKVYSIKEISTSKSQKFNFEQKLYSLDLNISNNQTFSSALNDFKLLFEQLYQDFVKPTDKNDKIKIVFEHELFKDNIWFPFMSPNDYSPDLIMNKFDMIVQSYKLNSETLEQKHNFKARIFTVKMPSGGALKGVKRVC